MLSGPLTVCSPRAEDWLVLKDAIRRFEDHWRKGPRPVIEDYLPTAVPLRSRVFIELVHIDLELRLKAGETARVEEYLARYPELAGDRAVTLGLIAAEYELRRRREPGLAVDEFLARFPQYQPELLPTRRGMHQAGATPPLRRICPQCHEPLDVSGDAARESVTCPSCGATILLELGRCAPWSQGRPRIGKYELLEELGRGAFDHTYF